MTHPPAVAALEARYGTILRERMQGLPIVNPRLRVEATAFREFEGGSLGILVTPWFMNLVYLRADADWSDEPQGASHRLQLPARQIEFTVNRDDETGTFLSAVLFRTVRDFGDQQLALDIAAQVMHDLFTTNSNNKTVMNRRNFLARLTAS